MCIRACSAAIGVIYYGKSHDYGYECKFVVEAMNFESASMSLDFEVAWS